MRSVFGPPLIYTSVCVRMGACMHACVRAASVRAGVGAGVGMSVQRIFVCACAYGQISVRLW